MHSTAEQAAPAAADPSTSTSPHPAALQPQLYEHADGRRLVALAGNAIVAGDPSWYRAGPADIDPALLQAALTSAIQAHLRPGEWYAGPVLNADGSVKHHLIVSASTTGQTFDGAQAFAAELGLSAPTKQETRLIVAHRHGRLADMWGIWTCEVDEDDSAYAWLCGLSFGDVNYTGRSAELGAVAVRRLILQSLAPSV